MKTKLCPLLVAVLTAGLQNNFAADVDLSKLAAANNNFAFKLLKQIATEQLEGESVVGGGELGQIGRAHV